MNDIWAENTLTIREQGNGSGDGCWLEKKSGMGGDGEGLENANRESSTLRMSNDGPVFLVSVPTIGVGIQLIAFHLQLQFSLQLSSCTSCHRIVGSFGFRGELLCVCTWKSTSQFLLCLAIVHG